MSRREIGVSPRRGEARRTLRVAHRGIAAADRLDERPHHGVVHAKERRQFDHVAIARRLGVGAGPCGCERCESALLEVHGEVGDLAGLVAAAHTRVELDRIERDQPIVERTQIPRVQIAVAFPHATRAHPFIESRATCLEPLEGLGPQPLEPPRGHHVDRLATGEGLEAGEVLLELPTHPVGAAVFVDSGSRRAGGMEGGQIRRERDQQSPQRRSLRAVAFPHNPIEPPIEQSRLGEPLHAHGDVDHLAFAGTRGHLQRAVGVANDRIDGKVDLGRRATIHAKFFLAEPEALRERGEVEKSQIDRLLHLPREVADEEHHRDVGLTRLDRRERRRIADSALAVGLRPRQRLDQFRKRHAASLARWEANHLRSSCQVARATGSTHRRESMGTSKTSPHGRRRVHRAD